MRLTSTFSPRPRHLYLVDDFTTGRYSIPLGRFTAERYARASLSLQTRLP